MPPKMFRLDVNEQDLEVLSEGLNELPRKRSQLLFEKLARQVAEQQLERPPPDEPATPAKKKKES